MKVSVVIPVSSDLRIKECIDSIGESVEVVIALNRPSSDLRKLVNVLIQEQSEIYGHLKIIACEINYPNIAAAYNNGITHSSYEKILLMDSDCIFAKDSISKLDQNLGENLLSKGRVCFLHNSWTSSIIARAREYHTSDSVNAFSPPLLFKKEIVGFIDGYYFHPSLCWLEDSEFDRRVRKAGLKIAYDPTAIVYHPPLTVQKDLHSAFWYGVGKKIGVDAGIHDKPTGFIGSVRKYLLQASVRKGIAVGIYLFLWKLSLLLGYNMQKLFKIRK